jgi:hypothetical protein
VYVSDVLSDLLAGAAPFRETVRRHCLTLVDRLPAEIARPIRPAAEYIGAKCMGYPPVWFVSRALGWTLEETDELLSRSHTALCISLSTSIADDFLDREAVGSSHLMFFYLLLFEALAQEDWGESGLGDFIYSKAVGTMDLFVLPGVRQQLRAGCDLETLEGMAKRSGLRIGNFHRMIAYSLLRSRPSASGQAAGLVDLAGRFGNWCSDLDDIIDVERDILQGEPSPLAALSALRLDPGLRTALVEADLNRLAECLDHPAFVMGMTTPLVRDIEAVAQGVRELGAEGFAGHLQDLARQLPGQIAEIRRLARQEYRDQLVA